MDAQQFLQLGVAGIINIVLWIMLTKSEKREEKKDTRIQMLENLLIESYDERIEAADRVSNAINTSASAANNAAKAIETLTVEVRAKQNG